ncbi:hypothetical protein [Peribacillus frigoritolerans]|uniref:hypothetical protein n=1 Tax=Peribacillus frigoritolerans TaxID=450367 RepID=UPI0039A1368E
MKRRVAYIKVILNEGVEISMPNMSKYQLKENNMALNVVLIDAMFSCGNIASQLRGSSKQRNSSLRRKWSLLHL